MYRVIGLRVEKYLGQTCSGHNCDFVYGKEERDRHVILLVDKDTNKNFELTLHWEEDQCGSGWCTSTEAFMELAEVTTFAGRTHSIKEPIYIKLNPDNEKLYYDGDYIENEVFTFSDVGGDAYYPSGSYEINMELFTPSSD